MTRITSTDGVAVAADALEIWDFGATRYQTVLGINPQQDRVGPGRALCEGLVVGRLFQASERNVVVADRHYAAFFGLNLGDQVTIGERIFQVVGIAEQSAGQAKRCCRAVRHHSGAGRSGGAQLSTGSSRRLVRDPAGPGCGPRARNRHPPPHAGSPGLLALAMGVALADGMLAGWLGARRAARLKPA